MHMTIYNSTGKPLSEKEWEDKFKIISAAYADLKSCVGGFDDDGDEKLRSSGVVLLAGNHVMEEGKEVWGLADKEFIYVPIDRSNQNIVTTMKHEWIHIYL